MIRSIAVTTDFSAVSREAFHLAAVLAKRFDARLFVVHVARTPEMVTPWQFPQSLEDDRTRLEDALNRLQDLVRSDSRFAGIDATPRALAGESAVEVARFLDEESIDLAVIATHGEAGMDHFPLGSFTADLLEETSRATLVVCSGMRRPRERPREASTPFAPAKVLVPYDFSHRSRTALRVARDWIQVFEARSRFLYVVSTVGARSRLASVELERLAAESSEELERTVRQYPDLGGADVVTRNGYPAAEILTEAEDFDADLIIMASRGLSPLERLDLGSVAEKIIHRCRTAVLIVKHPSATSPDRDLEPPRETVLL